MQNPVMSSWSRELAVLSNRKLLGVSGDSCITTLLTCVLQTKESQTGLHLLMRVSIKLECIVAKQAFRFQPRSLHLRQ